MGLRSPKECRTTERMVKDVPDKSKTSAYGDGELEVYSALRLTYESTTVIPCSREHIQRPCEHYHQ